MFQAPPICLGSAGGLRAAREGEAVEDFIGRVGARPHQVADMELGHFVVGHVEGGVVVGAQRPDQPADFPRLLDLHAHEDMGLVRVGVAVVELGDVEVAMIEQNWRKLPGRSGMVTARMASRARRSRRARPRGAGGRSSRWPRSDGDELLTAEPFPFHVPLEPGEGEAPAGSSTSAGPGRYP